jgi:outer membrane protein OmpA-like peptidoglycan-associated protein
MRLLCLAALCLTPRLVLASPVDLRIDARAEPGQKPKLTLVINQDLRSATVELSGGGNTMKRTQGPQARGGTLVFELPQTRPGVVNWKGTVKVTFEDDSAGSMPLSFQTEVLDAQFKFGFGRDDLDLENDTLKLTSERATAKVDIEVYTDEDELLVSSSQSYDPPIPAGQSVPVSWIPKKKADVLRIHLVVHDERGAYRSSDSFPYSITIPHEDVVFDTGKSVLRPDQAPKLEAAVPEIERATKRFGPAMRAAGATVRLFVGGHTDTVGPAGGNQALSAARATAIAKWFAGRGVPVAVYARGFGESMLKVETPDNTDNEANRRVEYDVGVNGPTGSLSGWTRIK